MSDILKYQKKDSGDELTFAYSSLRDIDDIIIQLVNEAADTGFIKSAINRKEKLLVYKPGALKPVEQAGLYGTSEDLIKVYRDLSEILDFLDASFIDLEYVLFDPEYVFADPDTAKLYLAVIPVNGIEEETGSLSDLVKAILNCFGQNIPKNIRDVVNAGSASGINNNDDLIRMIEDIEHAPEEDPSDNVSGQQKISDDGPSPADPEETKAAEQPDKTSDASDVSDAGEVEEEEEQEPAVISAPLQEGHDVSDEGPAAEEISTGSEGNEKPEKERGPAVFLLRRKTGEIIPLPEDASFIIGKLPLICDYVIANNPALSRIHAVIRRNDEDGRYYIADCNSTNHIYLNGTRIADSEPAVLEDKMRIHLATEEFVFNGR